MRHHIATTETLEINSNNYYMDMYLEDNSIQIDIVEDSIVVGQSKWNGSMECDANLDDDVYAKLEDLATLQIEELEVSGQITEDGTNEYHRFEPYIVSSDSACYDVSGHTSDEIACAIVASIKDQYKDEQIMAITSNGRVDNSDHPMGGEIKAYVEKNFTEIMDSYL